MSIRVLLADDHPMMREGVRAMLADEAGIEVVGEAGDGESAVRLAAERAPDVVVMDLRLPDMNGAEAVRRVKGRYPATRFIVMSAYADRWTAAAAKEAGASAVVPKDAAFEELAQAVRAVAAGGTYDSPTLRRLLAGGA